MAATIVIEVSLQEPWIETSPNDPQQGIVKTTGSKSMASGDDGPWTIQFPDRKLAVVVPGTVNNTAVTQATVSLTQFDSTFTVEVTTE